MCRIIIETIIWVGRRGICVSSAEEGHGLRWVDISGYEIDI